MFSATDPLASSPLAASGAARIVEASAVLTSGAQSIGGSASAAYVVYGGGNLYHGVQTVAGVSFSNRITLASADLAQGAQSVAGASISARTLLASGDLFQGAHVVSGSSVIVKIALASGDLNQGSHVVFATCYELRVKQASADLLQGVQAISSVGTKLSSIKAVGTLSAAAQGLNGAATRLRLLYGVGDLNAPAQGLYGSELWPIWIKTPAAPSNLYEVSRKTTSEPYSTANKYLTIYQVPGYRELQTDGTYRDINVTGTIMAMSASTANGTPQSVSVIVIRSGDIVSYSVMPTYPVINGAENIMPMRDFNLVTGDVIQVKSIGSGDATITMSLLLNTQDYFEVI